MDNKLKEIIDISIKLELNTSKLYTLFSQIFEEDKIFWGKLAEEEDGHALLLTKGKESFLSSDYFPSEMLSSNIDKLTLANLQLEKTIYKFKNDPPSREVAFQTAYKFELSAGELHFQKAMDNPNASEFLKMFQELNEDDKNHAKRIREYSQEQGMSHMDDFKQ